MSENSTQQQYSFTWIMLLALLTALGPLSIDMYLPALPQMADDFGVTTQSIANTLPAYFLGLAVGQLIYGPISDRIGRKKPLYFGLALYTVASLMCVFAQHEWSLIVLRVVQALGGCVGVVIARAAIRDRLDIQGAAQAFSSMMIVMGIAPIAAPTVGAWILHFFSWKAVFICLSGIGAISLFCVHFFFNETLPASRRLSLGVKQVFNLYLSIFKDKSFRFPMLAACLLGGALFSYISSASPVLMDMYRLNQQQFAYAFGFNAMGIILLSSLNKRLVGRLSTITRLKLGGSIQFVGACVVLMSGLVAHAPLWMVMVGLFLTISGLGFTGPNAMALAMSAQGSRAGTASAIMGSMQFGVGLLGGVVLNFLEWNSLINMGLMMVILTAAGMYAVWTISNFMGKRA